VNLPEKRGAMPLTMTKKGETCRIVRIGGNDKVRRHLENLGFAVGTEVTVVSSVSGSFIVNVKGSRVALGKELVSKIFI
jgi:ferrous iron transport protein A